VVACIVRYRRVNGSCKFWQTNNYCRPVEEAGCVCSRPIACLHEVADDYCDETLVCFDLWTVTIGSVGLLVSLAGMLSPR